MRCASLEACKHDCWRLEYCYEERTFNYEQHCAREAYWKDQGFSNRTASALAYSRTIKTIEDLLALSDKQLLRLRGIGKTSLADIRAKTPPEVVEARLREKLASVHRRYHDEAAPIIEQLAKLEAMKPPRPPLIYADLIPALAAKGYVSQVMQEHRWLIEDAKNEADAVARLHNQINGHAITRTWTDEEGKLTSERIDPKDFYAKPGGAGDA